MISRKLLIVVGGAFAAGCLLTSNLLRSIPSQKPATDPSVTSAKPLDTQKPLSIAPLIKQPNGLSASSLLPDAPPGYKKVVEKLTKKVDVVICKVVAVPKQKEVTFTVAKPVRESHQRVVKYQVTKLVEELHSQVVTTTVDGVEKKRYANYVVRVPVAEEREKLVNYTTVKIVREERKKTVYYTVKEPQRNNVVREKEFEVVRYEPI